MATLDDKILGEKLHYYCSSSEDENDSDDEKEFKDAREEASSSADHSNFIPPWDGSSVNTGPKGVIKDWQRFKQLEREKREADDREKIEMINKLSLTCQTHLEEEKQKAEEEEFQDLLEDKFFEEYLQKRMAEMFKQVTHTPKFGSLISIKDGSDFLKKVEDENKSVTVIVHIYTTAIQGCEAMNGCLEYLSQDYQRVKFCKLEAASAGMSKHFEKSGVPALLIYKGGNLIGSFVQMTQNFGEDFFATDVESFLLEHGLLPDKSLIPELVKSTQKDDDGSDFDD